MPADAAVMPDNVKNEEMNSSTVDQPRVTENIVVDDAPRHRSDYSDARQLLSETLRLRRAAQLQRATAGDTGSPSTAVSGVRRSAADDSAAPMTATPKRRKKPRHDRATDQPQPRVRRIMFHEYTGPSDDDLEPAELLSTPVQAASSTCFTSPRIMTTVFSPSVVTSAWKDFKNEPQTLDVSSHQSLFSPLTADYGSFRSTSSSLLPRFSELQRSLCSPTHSQDLVHLTPGKRDNISYRMDTEDSGLNIRPSHLQVEGREHPAPVCCSSTSASVCQRPYDLFYCTAATTSQTSSKQLPVTSSSSSPSHITSSQSQHCRLQSVTSPIDVTSGLLTSGGLDHVITCFPSVTAAYKPTTGNKSRLKFMYNAFLYYNFIIVVLKDLTTTRV